ncbi:MAG: SpoIIE family protein phosphatase [SAR324 cluster bacterium]|nr:SpoIIE family protein phosphatase [SAR324 cluster bacterium]
MNQDTRPLILVVDDSPDVLKFMVLLLKNSGFDILSLMNSRELETVLNEQKPDLILLDLYMPEMDGIAVLKFLKKSHYNIPVIMLTSENEKTMLASCLDFGAVDYITKPVHELELNARIHTALRMDAQYHEILELKNQLAEQLEEVGDIQKKLLVSQVPQTPFFDVEIFYEPTEYASGDYYDTFPIDDEHTAFVMADVSGHGAPAMVTMTLVRGYLRILTSKDLSPSDALVKLNQALWDTLPTQQYLTMFYSIFHHPSRTLRYACAGHTPPLIYQNQQHRVSVLKTHSGLPLKLLEAQKHYEEAEIRISSGDQLLLYTDGYSECMNENKCFLGIPQMSIYFERSIQYPAVLKNMVKLLHQYTGSMHKTDDIAMLLVKFK